MSRKRAAGIIAGVTVVVAVVSGCGPQMTDEELFDRAREVNFAAKAAMAEVQLQILDGEWDVWTYGDAPRECGSEGYEFQIERSTPTVEDWRLKGTPAEETARVGTWLEANGWKDIQHKKFSAGITNVVLKASKPDAFIREMTVDFSTGKVSDGAIIRLTTTCQPGNYQTVNALQTPNRKNGVLDIVEKSP